MTTKKHINPIVGYITFDEVKAIKEVIRIHAVAVRSNMLGRKARLKKEK